MAGNSVEKPRRRGPGRPFVKGQSGNPGGRPKEVGHVRELAKQYTEEAIETLVSIMRDDGQPGPRGLLPQRRCSTVFGRAPTQHVEMDVREQLPLLPYTDEELLQRLQAHVDEKRERAKRMH